MRCQKRNSRPAPPLTPDVAVLAQRSIGMLDARRGEAEPAEEVERHPASPVHEDHRVDGERLLAASLAVEIASSEKSTPKSTANDGLGRGRRLAPKPDHPRVRRRVASHGRPLEPKLRPPLEVAPGAQRRRHGRRVVGRGRRRRKSGQRSSARVRPRRRRRARSGVRARTRPGARTRARTRPVAIAGRAAAVRRARGRIEHSTHEATTKPGSNWRIERSISWAPAIRRSRLPSYSNRGARCDNRSKESPSTRSLPAENSNCAREQILSPRVTMVQGRRGHAMPASP